MLSDPEAVRDVFRGDGYALHSGEGNEFLKASLGSNSVLVLDEEPHARQRRIQLPPLKGERMRSYFEVMQNETRQGLLSLPMGKPVRMLEPMQQITLRVILHAVLGLAPGPARDEIETKVLRLLAQSRGRFGLILVKVLPVDLLQRTRWLPFYRLMHSLDQSLYAHIAACRKTPASERGASVLADLVSSAHEGGEPLSDVEIRDALLTLILAGHDTTSVALAWALEQIVPRPEVVARITEELRHVTGSGLPRAEHLGRLEYLDSTIRETLRLRTILPFVVRLTKKPFVAGGREYPAGVVLCPCSHLVHRRPDLYPSPEEFRPERFLERKYAGQEWFPFGGGGRTCLGMAFALYEMKVVLSLLFSELALVRPPGSRSFPIRRGLSLAPNDGAVMILSKRDR